MKHQTPNTLKEHRERAGLLQSDIAFILGMEKVRGTARIRQWEKGNSCPDMETLIKICMLYNVEPVDIYPDMAKRIHQVLGKIIKAQKKSKK
jgi:DNA-binding XRE family transcriptional regulator